MVLGGWTERLYTMMQRATSLGDQQEVVVLLDGPYGSQLQGAFNSPDMVLMSTGEWGRRRRGRGRGGRAKGMPQPHHCWCRTAVAWCGMVSSDV